MVHTVERVIARHAIQLSQRLRQPFWEYTNHTVRWLGWLSQIVESA